MVGSRFGSYPCPSIHVSVSLLSCVHCHCCHYDFGSFTKIRPNHIATMSTTRGAFTYDKQNEWSNKMVAMRLFMFISPRNVRMTMQPIHVHIVTAIETNYTLTYIDYYTLKVYYYGLRDKYERLISMDPKKPVSFPRQNRPLDHRLQERDPVNLQSIMLANASSK